MRIRGLFVYRRGSRGVLSGGAPAAKLRAVSPRSANQIPVPCGPAPGTDILRSYRGGNQSIVAEGAHQRSSSHARIRRLRKRSIRRLLRLSAYWWSLEACRTQSRKTSSPDFSIGCSIWPLEGRSTGALFVCAIRSHTRDTGNHTNISRKRRSDA